MSRGTSSKSASVAAATAHSAGDTVPRAAQSAATLSRKWSGIVATRRPSTSFNCSVAMTVAMPAVNPLVTG